MKLGKRQIPLITFIFCFTILTLFTSSCRDKKIETKTIIAPSKQKVIFDTDANNELDDQHALAYLLFNGDTCHDGASLKLIVDEAGGKVTDVYGDDQRYDTKIKGFIASNGVTHQYFVGLVAKYQ